MRLLHFAPLVALLSCMACQPQRPASVAIVDGSQLRVLATDARVPHTILAQAGVFIAPADELLFNGHPVALHAPLLAADHGTLQVWRAVNFSIDGVDHLTMARRPAGATLFPYTTLFSADG